MRKGNHGRLGGVFIVFFVFTGVLPAFAQSDVSYWGLDRVDPSAETEQVLNKAILERFFDWVRDLEEIGRLSREKAEENKQKIKEHRERIRDMQENTRRLQRETEAKIKEQRARQKEQMRDLRHRLKK